MIEYANDSSHIVAGTAPNRKIGSLGLQYEHRFLLRRIAEFDYLAEWRPVLLESDPAQTTQTTVTGPQSYQNTSTTRTLKCRSGISDTTFPNPSGAPYQVHDVVTCTRQITVAQGVSPAGFVWKFRPGARLQPIAGWQGGMLLSSKQIPVPLAGSFNFTYEFGVGLEYYLAPRRSIRVYYDVHHYSNKDTAGQNPGVDSGFVKLSYAFGH